MPNKPTGNSPRKAPGKTSQLSPKAAKSMADLARAADPNSGYGAKVIVFRDPATLPHARALIEKRALDGKPIADRMIPALSSLTSLFGGAATHEFAMARIINYAINGPMSADGRHRFMSAGLAREIDGSVMEGAHILLSHAERGGCVTVAQSLSKKQHEGFKEVLLKLDGQAKKEDVAIFLFLICLDGRPESWLQDYCSEVFVIDAYEPEPDASFGFSVSAMKLAQSHSLGVGTVACDVTITDNLIRHHWGTFVAATLEERAMLYLSQEGLSLRKISELFEIDDHVKVWRKLKEIAKRVTVPPCVDWREKYFDCLGLDPGGHDADKQRADNHALQDEDAGDWDDDPAHAPQMKPRIA